MPTSRPLTIEQQQTPRTSRQHLRLETIDRAVLSDDVRDALHQLELVNQVPRTSAQKVERAVRVAGRVRQR